MEGKRKGNDMKNRLGFSYQILLLFLFVLTELFIFDKICFIL